MQVKSTIFTLLVKIYLAVFYTTGRAVIIGSCKVSLIILKLIGGDVVEVDLTKLTVLE